MGAAHERATRPVEHALSLLVSGDPDAALRWSAAALESDAASPAALLVTAHALWRVGHKRAAIDAFTAAARRAALAGDVPLAIAAIAELRAAGVDVERLIAEVARVGVPRVRRGVRLGRASDLAWEPAAREPSAHAQRACLESHAAGLRGCRFRPPAVDDDDLPRRALAGDFQGAGHGVRGDHGPGGLPRRRGGPRDRRICTWSPAARSGSRAGAGRRAGASARLPGSRAGRCSAR